MIDNAITIIENDWPAIESAILDNVTDWSVCIQAGGHHGTYPKYLSRLFNTVYTFEADIDNFKILEANCHEPNIIAYNKALSSYKKRVDVKRFDGSNSGQSFVTDGCNVEAVTIDSLKLDYCGLIQLDIERHEMHAIIGAIETIETYRPVIILEGPETTNNTCNHILDQLGYRAVGRAGFDTVFKFINASKPYCEYIPI